MIVFHTNLGLIKIELEKDRTPKTVQNFLRYIKNDFYRGTIFHRVIDGFMIQGGGYSSGLVTKPTLEPIENEADLGLSNKVGTIAMARTNDPHSATSQFFINVKDNPFLDFQSKSPQGWGYCAFGTVIEGMQVVYQIAKTPTGTLYGYQDVPEEEIIIERVECIETA